MGLNEEKVIEKKSDKNYKSNHGQNHQDLKQRSLLNFMLIFYFTNLTGAMLSLFLVNQVVEQATEANTKNRFKKQEDQANQAN